jgi:hypothetical protein
MLKMVLSNEKRRFAMTRFLKHCCFPYVSSTLVAILVSIAATLLFVPVIATPRPAIEHSKSLSSSDSSLYRLSPIPAGADWGRS